ncbi:MAG: hypothetical protein IJX68_08220 [Rikenellaceae bacterium]|nr:hypothetical protein [Rikenellaceae bacterium]
MAFDKEKTTQLLVSKFDKIATEASASNPATKIVAAAIAEAIQQAFTDAEVTGTATVESKQGTIKGTIK